jgi:hypothetical protein
MESQEDPLIGNRSGVETGIPISAVFPDGSRKTFHFDHFSTVEDLIQLIISDETIEKPTGKVISVMYHGRFLKPEEKFSEIDNLPDYAVSVLYRIDKNAEPEIPWMPELQGFDRLIRMDYSPEEISLIRERFHHMRGGENETDAQKIDAEEEWLPVLFNNEGPAETLDIFGAAQPIRFNQRAWRQPRANMIYLDQDARRTNNTSFWISFSIAFLVSFIFGPVTLLYILVSMNDRGGILGVLLGVASHFIIRSCFNFSVI